MSTAPVPAVQLDVLWLNDAVDPRIAIGLRMLAGSTRTWPAKVTLRDYAKGRRRAVRTPRGATRSWTPLLAPLPLAVANQLEARAGDPFWARDVLGGKVACVWDGAPQNALGRIGSGDSDLVQVTLTLNEFSHRELARRLGPGA